MLLGGVRMRRLGDEDYNGYPLDTKIWIKTHLPFMGNFTIIPKEGTLLGYEGLKRRETSQF